VYSSSEFDSGSVALTKAAFDKIEKNSRGKEEVDIEDFAC
jgi:hypothetical protein